MGQIGPLYVRQKLQFYGRYVQKNRSPKTVVQRTLHPKNSDFLRVKKANLIFFYLRIKPHGEDISVQAKHVYNFRKFIIL